MTDAQKITLAKAFIGDDANATDDLISAYLLDAESAILRRRYPFGIPDNATVENNYALLQIKLAVRYFLRRGGEGETKHSENGVDRTYGSVNDEDLLMEVTPFAKLI